MLKEVQRVLKPSGSYMAITYGSPDSRVHHFKRKHLAFDLTEYTISKELRLCGQRVKETKSKRKIKITTCIFVKSCLKRIYEWESGGR